MKIFSALIPSKSFLCGEYLALCGGPSILINTAPFFQLNIETSSVFKVNGIAPSSPAGKWLSEKENKQIAGVSPAKIAIEFLDPYLPKGGFGASTAQFAGLLKFDSLKSLEPKNGTRTLAGLRQEELLCYQSFAGTQGGLAPSGYDLISQADGGPLSFIHQSQLLDKFNWPDWDLGFSIIRTGNKLATHNHLQDLRISRDVLGFAQACEDVCNLKSSLQNSEADTFIKHINGFTLWLEQMHFVAETTNDLIQKLAQQCPILAAKGCGAMGADTIFIVYFKNERSNILKALNSIQLQETANDQSLVEPCFNIISEGQNFLQAPVQL